MKKFPNVVLARHGRRIFLGTENAYPGVTHFEEFVKKVSGKEVRTWDPERSKVGAALAKEISQLGVKEGSVMLYLGAGHGYTPSFVSDIVGTEGWLFCLDHAPRVVRDLYFVCEKRSNMVPLMGDARHPEEYE